MEQGYEILEVRQSGANVVAILPLAQVAGHDVSRMLEADYVRLAASCCTTVELDLRPVEHIDGTCFTRLLKLRNALEFRAIHLDIRVSANLLRIIQFTKLDRLLQVSVDPTELKEDPV